jgi:hypothetical protein
MRFFADLLERPFTGMRLEQQIVVIFILALCISATVGAIAWTVRRIKHLRAHWRHPLSSAVEVHWWDEQKGDNKESQGWCRDISKGGLKMQLREPIPPGTSVRVRIIDSGITRLASVRYCTPSRPGFIIGIQFHEVSS